MRPGRRKLKRELILQNALFHLLQSCIVYLACAEFRHFPHEPDFSGHGEIRKAVHLQDPAHGSPVPASILGAPLASKNCTGFQERQVFRVLLGEDFGPPAHVRSHQLVRGDIEVLLLIKYLPEP